VIVIKFAPSINNILSCNFQHTHTHKGECFPSTPHNSFDNNLQLLAAASENQAQDEILEGKTGAAEIVTSK